MSRLRRSYGGQAIRDSQICLNESWTCMDIDLAEKRVAGVHESVRCVRGNDNNAASIHFARFISNRNRSGAFKSECDFDIGMRMQRRTLPWLRLDNVSRNGRAVFVAVKLVGHSDKWQLLEMDEAHSRVISDE